MVSYFRLSIRLLAMVKLMGVSRFNRYNDNFEDTYGTETIRGLWVLKISP
jgi:hypothetical protein